jgi:hypothetical protein
VQTTIKPEDIVRTRSGRTCIVREIRPRHFRLIEDMATGQLQIVHADELYLVRAAKPKRWPDHILTPQTA